MCGICGQIRFNGKESSYGDVVSMTKALKRRGPDATGLYAQEMVVLGHRRLKIIDLSERAHQPMVDNTLGLSIVYNGAIYNYNELRVELEKKGYTFFSCGDTEVILKAYHAWGKQCVERLNGMFAFAITSREDGEVFLARDRLGIKPLYYIKTADEFRFASTLPALLAGGDVDTNIDPVSLHYYMTFHTVVPAPRTILRGVRKLPPASTLTITSEGKLLLENYWSLTFEPSVEEEKYTFEDWKKLLSIYLQSAVKRRLVADVPVGVLLSGGVDSSLVVGLLSGMGQPNLNTFSIGFESVNGEDGNEFEYSDVIASHFATQHHKIHADSKNILPSLEDCVLSMSEPMASHDCIGFYLLGKAVSRYVKVVQSGQGADEIFGGYHWYPPLFHSKNAVTDYAKGFFDRDHMEFLAAVHRRFSGDDHSLRFVNNHFDLPGTNTAIDQALRIDTTVMLVDDPVKRLDNMTMAWGLEARVPFLDHELVEFAARIPDHYKVQNGGKHILKEVARDIIPSGVIDRPKGYFPVPALKYIQGEYLDFVKDILTHEAITSRRLFDPGYVSLVMKAPDEHITPLNGSKLWQMALLEYWLTSHGI